jgi:hypothetical protein
LAAVNDQSFLDLQVEGVNLALQEVFTRYFVDPLLTEPVEDRHVFSVDQVLGMEFAERVHQFDCKDKPGVQLDRVGKQDWGLAMRREQSVDPGVTGDPLSESVIFFLLHQDQEGRVEAFRCDLVVAIVKDLDRALEIKREVLGNSKTQV